jgi:hypothetical protein
MEQYDIIFINHVAAGEIEPFQGESFFGHGGASFFGAMAAAPLEKKLLVITRMSEADGGGTRKGRIVPTLTSEKELHGGLVFATFRYKSSPFIVN